MTANLIIAFLWLVFLGYWTFSMKGTKRTLYRADRWWQRIGFIVVILFVLFAGSPYLKGRLIHESAALDVIAVIVCALGVGTAIWARRHLGANWSATPSLKEGHELVTSGPYRFVRHPIYTGMLLALFGSALVSSKAWVIVLVGMGAMFVYRVGVEERLMMKQFPEEYPAYRKRTKALIPFVL